MSQWNLIHRNVTFHEEFIPWNNRKCEKQAIKTSSEEYEDHYDQGDSRKLSYCKNHIIEKFVFESNYVENSNGNYIKIFVKLTQMIVSNIGWNRNIK
jgi:hypothetical protein